MSTSSLLSSLLSSSQSSTSSAIDLSSILEAMTGASTAGIDVTAAVSSAVTAARAPENAWQTDITTLSSHTTDLTSLSTAVTQLETDLNALNSPTGVMNSQDLTSSNSAVLTGTASIGAVAGTHTITVINLAQTGSWYSDPVTSAVSAAGGSFNIVTGSGSTAVSTPITMAPGETLGAVASDINNQSLGVTASVITDSSGSRLSIVSNTSGANGTFSVSGMSSASGTSTPFLGFTQAQPGKDASIMFDGTPTTSATNTFTGIMSGVTLNLASASTTPVSVTIAPDATSAASAIQSFVTDYNSIVKTLSAQFSPNGTTGAEGDLAGDSVVRSLQQQLLAAMTYGNKNSNLGMMGISMGNDGTLTINSTTLNNELTNNFSAVQNFFQGSGLNGFAAKVGDTLDTFTDPTNGAFTVDLQSMKSQSAADQTSITNFESSYIVPLQAQLQAEFNKAEIALQSLPQQQAQLNAELGNNTSSK